MVFAETFAVMFAKTFATVFAETFGVMIAETSTVMFTKAFAVIFAETFVFAETVVLISLYFYHFSTVIDFSSKKYSGCTGHRNS